jgi:hypothetical protein
MAGINDLIALYERAQRTLLDRLLVKATRFDRALLDSINAELAQLQGKSDALLDELIPAAYRASILEADAAITAQYVAAGKTAPKTLGAWSVLHKEAVKILADNAKSDFGSAIAHVGRRVQDNIRQASLDAIANKVATGTTVQKTRQKLREIYEQEGVQAVKYMRGGKPAYMSLSSYADIVARSTTAEATNQATLNETQAVGSDLVRMSEHNTSCSICLPLQGRVYSISGKDKRFPELSVAYSGDYANIHPRCRHRLTPWIEALKDPDEIASDVEKSSRSFDVGEWDPVAQERAQRSLAAYNAGQAKKRELYQDRQQYERYRTRLGPDSVPKTFSGFRSMKRADGEKWGVMQAQVKGMQYYDKAVKNEPGITSAVTGIAGKLGVDTVGLEYRIKSKESYLRKIKSNFRSSGNTYEVKDIIRYTYTAPPEQITEKALRSIEEFEKIGYTTVEVKNSWLDDNNPYKGINTTMRSPTGQKFELQYHTPDSFVLKDGKLHKLYEKARELDQMSDEYFKLNDEMIDLSSKLTVPTGIERVKNRK